MLEWVDRTPIARICTWCGKPIAPGDEHLHRARLGADAPCRRALVAAALAALAARKPPQ